VNKYVRDVPVTWQVLLRKCVVVFLSQNTLQFSFFSFARWMLEGTTRNAVGGGERALVHKKAGGHAKGRAGGHPSEMKRKEKK